MAASEEPVEMCGVCELHHSSDLQSKELELLPEAVLGLGLVLPLGSSYARETKQVVDDEQLNPCSTLSGG